MSRIMRMPEIAALTADDIDTLVGEELTAGPLGFTGEPFRLRLLSVTRHAGGTGFRAPFSLELLGPPSPVQAQGTYRLAHPRLGDLDLFMVPVGASPDGVTYEITFG